LAIGSGKKIVLTASATEMSDWLNNPLLHSQADSAKAQFHFHMSAKRFIHTAHNGQMDKPVTYHMDYEKSNPSSLKADSHQTTLRCLPRRLRQVHRTRNESRRHIQHGPHRYGLCQQNLQQYCRWRRTHEPHRIPQTRHAPSY